MEAAASIDQKLDARQDDPSKHVTIMTMKCTKLLVIVPILCLIFFRAHGVWHFHSRFIIFLSSWHCQAIFASNSNV